MLLQVFDYWARDRTGFKTAPSTLGFPSVGPLRMSLQQLVRMCTELPLASVEVSVERCLRLAEQTTLLPAGTPLNPSPTLRLLFSEFVEWLARFAAAGAMPKLPLHKLGTELAVLQLTVADRLRVLIDDQIIPGTDQARWRHRYVENRPTQAERSVPAMRVSNAAAREQPLPSAAGSAA